MRTSVATAFADNPIGRLLEDLVLQGGVDTSHISWVPYDGIGASVRNGLNFTERGFGVRGAVGCSDRANSAASQLAPGDVDWATILGTEGARWLHTGGIFVGLGATTPALAAEAIDAAHRSGAIVSFDLNFRESLWKSRGGAAAARAAMQELVRSVDVVIGNEEDYSAALGIAARGVDPDFQHLDAAAYRPVLEEVAASYPNLAVIAATLRVARTASRNDWGAVAFADGAFHEATLRPDLDILDRIGGGDSFASGLIYGLLMGKSVAEALEYGAAHGALAMTTPGDTSMASREEVERLVRGGGARVSR